MENSVQDRTNTQNTKISLLEERSTTLVYTINCLVPISRIKARWRFDLIVYLPLQEMAPKPHA